MGKHRRLRGFFSALLVTEASFMLMTWAALNHKIGWARGLVAAALMTVTAIIVGIWVDRPK